MINTRSLRTVNLNILPVMWELLRCRNVSLAASNLNLTQSTVSGALKRLREMFDDEILVQQGRQMVLSERAEALLPVLEAMLEQAGILVDGGFDPARSSVRFRVVTADYVTAIIAPALIESLQAKAPGVTLQIMPGRADDLTALRMGAIDLMIGPDQVIQWINAGDRQSELRVEPCFVDPLVGIERTGAPAGAHTVDPEAFLRHPHASFRFDRDFPGSIEHDVLAAGELIQNDRLLVPEFTLLPMLVSTLDLISVVPLSIARLFGRVYPITVFEPPVAFPPLKLNLLWARARAGDTALSWFVSELRACFDRLRAESVAASGRDVAQAAIDGA